MDQHFAKEATPVPIPTNLEKTPGEVIKEWRLARGFLSQDLVRRAGPPISQPYLSQLEKGRIKNPGDEHILKLASALNISPGHILCRIGPTESTFLL